MYRVLIADDDQPFVESLKVFDWHDCGCVCVYAAMNGAEALAKCGELMPHIVVADINMPMMDGIALLRELHARYPEICVILLTVQRDFECAREAIRFGACGYLVKDMEFRARLPDVLERAKGEFERRGGENDRRVRLLQRGGKLLCADTQEVLEAYAREAEEFISAHGGTLMTVETDAPMTREELVRRLDGTEDIPNMGWIIRPGFFEILAPLPASHAERIVAGLSVVHAPFAGMKLYAAVSEHVHTLEAYRDAHANNVLTLRRAFYHAQAAVRRARNAVPFTQMSARVLDELESCLRKAEHDENGLAHAVKTEVVPRIACRQYEPGQVRALFGRSLYRLEARYADRLDDQAHGAIRAAMSLGDTVDAFLRAAKHVYAMKPQYGLVCEKALALMTERLSDSTLVLADVAACVYISPGYLSKQLKAETGYAFQDLLTRMRMERAARLLKDESKKVYEIALLCGYLNYRSFSAAFQAFYHVSPRRYAKAAEL